ALSFSGVPWVGNDTRPTGGTLTSLPPPTDQPACNETCPGPTRPDAPASGNTATPSTTAATTVTTHRPTAHPRRRPSAVMPALLRPKPPCSSGSQPADRADCVKGRERLSGGGRAGRADQAVDQRLQSARKRVGREVGRSRRRRRRQGGPAGRVADEARGER